jgi:hypothetical protein
VSSYEFDTGFYLSVDTYLSDTLGQFKERRIAWYHDFFNYVLVRYDQSIEQLVCICVVNEQWVFYETADVEMSEWDGTDCKWHTLAIQIDDDQLTVLRNGEIIFEHSDPLISHMPSVGKVELSNTYSGTCFDNVLLRSIGEDPVTCGDADGSGEVDIDDAVYLIAFIFSGGPAPNPYHAGDANCSIEVDIDDVVYLIAYIFSGGNDPCDTDGDESPDC